MFKVIDKSIIKADEMVLNMGPQHPSTHGVLRLKIITDGEITLPYRTHTPLLRQLLLVNIVDGSIIDGISKPKSRHCLISFDLLIRSPIEGIACLIPFRNNSFSKSSLPRTGIS